jgi:hypothetical protein
MHASHGFPVMLSLRTAAVNGVKCPQVLTSRQFAAPSVFSPSSEPPAITNHGEAYAVESPQPMQRRERSLIKKIFLAELTT